ncbi:MAG: tRNA-dihydrouridine synthase family protein, partial [Alistipes sp.]|nr:tRNA-dihydrouridine synthase family protein [Alistipes sp.]
MKIADLDLGEKPLFLAPMEDVTDPSFRYMCKRFGADVVYTEFVPADGLIRDAAKALKKLEIDEAERPVGIQIYGHLIEPMVEAARMVDAAGPDIIDINFGCPVKKVAGKGAGAGMLRDIPKMLEITRAVVDAVKLPVTVKTRLGWDHNSKIIVDLAEQLQDCGIKALTVHGRTRSQMYTGEADWEMIAKVKE